MYKICVEIDSEFLNLMAGNIISASINKCIYYIIWRRGENSTDAYHMKYTNWCKLFVKPTTVNSIHVITNM